MSTSGGNFLNPTLEFNSKGQLVVKGPFAADPADLIGTGLIRFLLIKKEGTSSSPTSLDPRITQYYGFYNPQDDLNNWVGNVPEADIKTLGNLGVTATPKPHDRRGCPRDCGGGAGDEGSVRVRHSIGPHGDVVPGCDRALPERCDALIRPSCASGRRRGRRG